MRVWCKNLRAAGGNSFTPYEIDFFFNLPDEAACASLRNTLEPEGFAIDTRIMSGEGASGYSLHARKHLRISVSEMQDFSQRFRALAQQLRRLLRRLDDRPVAQVAAMARCFAVCRLTASAAARMASGSPR